MVAKRFPLAIKTTASFFLNSSVKFEDVTDGYSNTIFVGEKLYEGKSSTWSHVEDPNQAIATYGPGWYSGTNATLRNTGLEFNTVLYHRGLDLEIPKLARKLKEEIETKKPLYVGSFGSHHTGGAHFGFGDGRVNFLSESMEFDILHNLSNRHDGNLLGEGY